jgi:heparan-alpha-glucosaminide N-acetyltransferase
MPSPSNPSAPRTLSIDAFRGLTILAMILVNDLASVSNIPAWMKHAVDGTDSMTFVDLVFPAFLFIVGMSIPLALGSRVQRGASTRQLVAHVFTRSAGLLVLGVFMVNIHDLNERATGISRDLWMVLMFVCAIAVWSRYPAAKGARTRLLLSIRILGVLGLVALAIVYRGGDANNLTWMKTSWWGILGLIGWSYLFASLAYLAFRNNIAVLSAIVALSVALYIGDKAGALDFAKEWIPFLWIGGHVGGHLSITLAGMIATLITQGHGDAPTLAKRFSALLALAVALAAGGYLLRPLYGISKNMATPAWSLYSAAICTLLYAGLRWVVDTKAITRWTVVVEPAGSNPLLAYILPDICYGIIGMLGITWYWEIGSGTAGIVRSAVFALAMVWVTGVVARRGVRMRM